MGLATRIIPTILSRHGALAKGRAFKSDRVVGHALQAARIHQMRDVDELLFLDVAATPEGRGPDFEMISNITDGCFMPLAVGGGIKTVDDVRKLFNAGADKVVIGTAAAKDPEFIRACSSRFGSQAIVVSIDVKMFVAFVGNKPVGYDAISWAKKAEQMGAGEILLQSIDRDGTMEGYDLELIRMTANAVNIPVIASGGCRDYEDMYQAIKAGAHAVAAGALFIFTDATPKGAAQYLASKGVEVRL